MLTEKIDTYADVVYADEYISKNYRKYAPLRVHWSVLTDEEKEQYLRASLSEIERLMFIGRKTEARQPLQFPRRRDKRVNGYPPFTAYPLAFFEDSSIVPDEVKAAQTENALGLIYEEINAVSDRQFMTMQSLGAVKNTKYNKREAGDLGFGAELTGSAKIKEITSAKAYNLLRGWMGGYRC